jgi:hypothetical protein
MWRYQETKRSGEEETVTKYICRLGSIVLVTTLLCFGSASLAEDKIPNDQPSTSKSEPKRDAGSNTDVGVEKQHKDQTGHHRTACGGVKMPNSAGKNR